MKAGPLTFLLICASILWTCCSNLDAQIRSRSPRTQDRLTSDSDFDLNKVWGRCGCDTCNGRLEHNDPIDEEDGKNGAGEFNLVPRWSSTALSGAGLFQGDPTMITWSIVPDGTDANGGAGFVPSNLIAVFDNLFNEPNAGDPDLTNRFWHGLIQQSLDRWGEVSGIIYVYEPNDDGVSNFGAPGAVGVRGDARIGGFNIDGPNGILAFNQFPNVGDMAIDTSDTGLYGNAGAGYRLFRNVFTHEQGHGIGFAHVESNNAAFLMEPFISGSFDGPQLDDVRAVHRHYGDVNEKSNNFAGNDSINTATDFGSDAGVIDDGGSETIGIDGATGTAVNLNDDDFVSIDDNGDLDFYRINLAQPAFIDVTLTPVGAAYNQSQQGGGGGIPTDPSSSSNLSLALFNASGSLITLSNSGGVGEPEIITGQVVANGDTFIRVSGNANTIQLYTLSVSADFISVPVSTPPLSVTASPGLVVGGDVSDLAESDNQTLDLMPEITGNPAQDSIAAVLNYVAPTATPTSLTFTVEGAVSTVNLNQTISLFNRDTGMFEVIDSGPAPLEDDSVTISPSGNPQRFVQFPSGAVLAEIRYVPTGPVVGYPWTVRLDHAVINTIE